MHEMFYRSIFSRLPHRQDIQLRHVLFQKRISLFSPNILFIKINYDLNFPYVHNLTSPFSPGTILSIKMNYDLIFPYAYLII